MTMQTVSWVRCDRLRCLAEYQGNRPSARAEGWACDSPRGFDLCPDHKGVGPKARPRGVCAFCGCEYAVSHTGRPTAHTTAMVTRCPGSYMQVRGLLGGAS